MVAALLLLPWALSPLDAAPTDTAPTKQTTKDEAAPTVLAEQGMSTPVAAPEQPPLPRRARVKLFAMLGLLTAVGLATLLFVFASFRALRRYLHGIDARRNRAAGHLDPDDWARKPLTPPTKRSTAPPTPGEIDDGDAS